LNATRPRATLSHRPLSQFSDVEPFAWGIAAPMSVVESMATASPMPAANAT
jgi:hypothetical protein